MVIWDGAVTQEGLEEMALVLLLSQLIAAQAEPVAVISLFNPTPWAGPMVVEAPAGAVGSPGAIDWQSVRMEAGGRPVAFDVRNGGIFADDPLVFVCAVAPGEWARVEVFEGAAKAGSSAAHLVRENGQAVVTYAGMRAVVDEATGRLLELAMEGEPLLAGPMTIEAHALTDAAPYVFSGGFGVGYADPADPNAPAITLGAPTGAPLTCKLKRTHSTEVMTELVFGIETEKGPAVELKYKFYSNGMVDIVAEGLEWQGDSPWCNHAMSYGLPLAGNKEPLPYLEDRFPFYGFKGYTASVRQAAAVWRAEQGGVVELGEETVNGRRWARKLVPFGPASEGLVEAIDEGYVVDISPKCAATPKHIKVLAPEAAGVVAHLLAGALIKAGCEINELAKESVLLELLPESGGIKSDGFSISFSGSALWIRARTVNGLYQAVAAIARQLERDGRWPLISRNPAVELRAGGFGGGDMEVDFPYGGEDEWKQVLGKLLDSGMNTFACLGMWGNWKMPVKFSHMPELQSEDPSAYDESSGAKLSEVDEHREKALRLTQFLHERGGRVWLWVPIGCVPTTFAQRFKEAMAPAADGGRSEKIPCFTHPDYARYVEAFFRELLETYPIDGLVLIRDDNGGLCTCERCSAYVAGSRTKSAAWEQYLVIYDLLRNKGFTGDISVYPYFDGYRPELEPLLPKDLYVIGHGGEPAVLARDSGRIGLMGDTWLDNLYANFRLPPTPRMRRLLGDRGSFWIGGAYCGTELPWESVGRFGWEPTATPNTLRYEWGARTFGREHALAFVRMNQTYEHLWEINARYMPPAVWMKLGAEERQRVFEEGVGGASLLRSRLEQLRQEAGPQASARWFAHMELFAPFFEYHLHRLELFARIHDVVLAHKDAIEKGERLPEDARRTVAAWYQEMYDWAAKYDAAMQQACGTEKDGMLAHSRGMTSPYREWMAGYDQWLEWQLKMKQFVGTMTVTAGEAKAGQPFAVRVELRNTGVCPWIPGVGQELRLSGVAEQVGLPKARPFEGEWLLPGDSRTIELQATAPATPGGGVLTVGFTSAFRVSEEFVKGETNVAWN